MARNGRSAFGWFLAGAAGLGLAIYVAGSARRARRRRRVLLTVLRGDVSHVYAGCTPARLRGRANLPSGDSQLLPETVGAPTSAEFPLVLLASGDARDAGIEACALEAFDMLQHQGLLRQHGAVLLRGLPIATAQDFARFCGALGWTSTQLGGGGTARTVLAGKVRTASDEPAEHTIEPHLDMAHNAAYPARIGFMMLHGPPPGCGGETVLVDMRLVTRDMKALGLDAAFARRGGVVYRKKLWSRLNVGHLFTWQARYFTDERAEVEAQLRAAGGVRWEWTAEGTLVFENTLPAVSPHPETGEELWFNGIHTNHRDYFELAPHVDTTDGSPFDTLYADGGEIDPHTLAQIRASIWGRAVAVALKSGDIVIVDNMLAAHGRLGWTPGVPRQMLLNHF